MKTLFHSHKVLSLFLWLLWAASAAAQQFVWADAVIEKNTIVVSSPDVPEPRYVRYGWAWNPIVNLYNKEGLPAIPFRTDE